MKEEKVIQTCHMLSLQGYSNEIMILFALD